MLTCLSSTCILSSGSSWYLYFLGGGFSSATVSCCIVTWAHLDIICFIWVELAGETLENVCSSWLRHLSPHTQPLQTISRLSEVQSMSVSSLFLQELFLSMKSCTRIKLIIFNWIYYAVTKFLHICLFFHGGGLFYIRYYLLNTLNKLKLLTQNL